MYVKSVLTNKNKWKLVDALHLTPFLLIAINYIPLYCMGIDNKKEVVKLVIQSFNNNYNIQDGFFTEKIQFLRPIQSIVYIILQWKLIYSFKRKQHLGYFKEHTELILSWLIKFTSAITFTILTFLIFVIGVVYTLYTNQSINDIVFYASIPVSISLFYLTSYLILNPNVFLGLPYIDYNKYNQKIEVLDKVKYEEEIAAIESYLTNNKPYLKQGFSINEFSMAVGLPAKLVSFLINNHFDKNFNDFVNTYRIAQVTDCIKAGDFNQFTLYALATQAGFSNKTSFVDAFKKVHNCTPSHFISNLIVQ